MSSTATTLRDDAKVIGLVGAAHMVSHFCQLVMPPLFPLLKDEFGLSYTQLGFVMTVFFSVSGLMQTVAGVMVDRFGARRILLAGVGMISFGILLAGFAPSYPLLLAAAMVAGLGNSVFHPADFAVLNAKVELRRLGHAFSVHGIGGNIGWALAPLYSVSMAAAFGWRTALVVAGALGFVVLAVLISQRETIHVDRHALHGGAHHAATRGEVRVLFTPAVLLCFLFFTLLSMALIGTQNYSIPVLRALYDAPMVTASAALTGFLLAGAAGMLTGGFIAGHTRRHEWVAAGGVFACSIFFFALASGAVPLVLIVPAATLAGFAFGIVQPSRDIIVREAAPVHSRGKVYGFVYSGLDLGASLAPTLLGWLLDHGQLRGILMAIGACLLLCIGTIIQAKRLHK